METFFDELSGTNCDFGSASMTASKKVINMTPVCMYTDGACSGNPGKGGYAALIFASRKDGSEVKHIVTGNAMVTTNNKMELKAVIEGVRALKKPCAISCYSDSAVVCGYDSYKSRGWKTAAGKLPANFDLWMELEDVLSKGGHRLMMNKVAGHAGNEYNEECDQLAKAAIA